MATLSAAGRWQFRWNQSLDNFELRIVMTGICLRKEEVDKQK